MKKLSTYFVVAATLLAIATPLSQVTAQDDPKKDHTQVLYTDDVSDPSGQPRRELQDENISMKEISVFPNPASDVLNVDFGHSAESRHRIVIYDLLGNHVWSQDIDESGAQVSISKLNPGVYILIADNQTFKIQKI